MACECSSDLAYALVIVGIFFSFAAIQITKLIVNRAALAKTGGAV